VNKKLYPLLCKWGNFLFTSLLLSASFGSSVTGLQRVAF
jgi:hypothetical protein